MARDEDLEHSVAGALKINQKEIDHLMVLKQLRRTIEQALSRPFSGGSAAETASKELRELHPPRSIDDALAALEEATRDAPLEI
jgi:hypothetical protein